MTEPKLCSICGVEYFSTHPFDCDKCIEHEFRELQRSGDVHGEDCSPEDDRRQRLHGLAFRQSIPGRLVEEALDAEGPERAWSDEAVLKWCRAMFVCSSCETSYVREDHPETGVCRFCTDALQELLEAGALGHLDVSLDQALTLLPEGHPSTPTFRAAKQALNRLYEAAGPSNGKED